MWLPQVSVYQVNYNPLFIFHRIINDANGNSTSDTAIHAKRTPKSSPIFECVPNRIVRSALTTNELLAFDM